MINKATVLLLMVTFVMTACADIPTCRKTAFSPCNCNEVETTKELTTKDGREVKVKFSEFVCDHIKNSQRRSWWMTSHGLQCSQLVVTKVLHDDINGMVIDEKISFKAGCELRCLNLNCHWNSNKKSTQETMVHRDFAKLSPPKSNVKVGRPITEEGFPMKRDLQTICSSGAVARGGGGFFCKVVVSNMK